MCAASAAEAPATSPPPAARAADGEEAPSRISVAVRCRPLSEAERGAGCQDIVKVMNQRLVVLMDPSVAASNDYLRMDKSREKRYAFDQAFRHDAGTEEVFEATTKPLIGAVMQAYNATVFAYGSTGAGKTFTMLGTPQDPGVMVRTVEALFDSAADAGRAGDAVAIRCSFIEVYNENLRDLLAGDARDGGSCVAVDLREDPERGTCVAGVTEAEAESAAEVADLLCRGNARRTTEPTAMNVTSSRSHAVLQIAVERRAAGEPQIAMLGKLSMIDLAGSERASQTDNRGVRLLEGANINRSLLALGNCINALASGCGFVPYRDSKLTRLLKDSLGGNCRTVMVANVSPSHLSYEDTLNTLKYANRAKNIRVSARQNIVQPEEHVSQYEKAINDLRSEVALLKKKLARRETPVALPQDAGEPSEPGDESDLREASEHWKEEMVRNLECRTQLQRSLIEIDRGLAQWAVEKSAAQEAIRKLDEPGGAASPEVVRRSSSSGPRRTLEDWQDQLVQIEESVRENLETRASIEERLQQNRAAGKELQAQLPQRVLNEDMRAFLELIQRVQVLEVERLELDHQWERQRARLDERDQEIAMLREQLRLRNDHLRAQRERLSLEQQQQLPGRVSILGSTLVEAPPVQQRGPLRVVHAWAPPPKDPDDYSSWDSRPLRERAPAMAPLHDQDDDPREGSSSSAVGAVPLPPPIDWRNLEVPRVSQIRGIARLQPPGSCQRLAPKGWREPPDLRPRQTQSPPPPHGRHPAAEDRPAPKPTTGGSAGSRGAGPRSTPQVRGSTCPPLRRPLSIDAHAGRRPIGDAEAPEAPRRVAVPRPCGGGAMAPAGRAPAADLRAQGLAPPHVLRAAGPTALSREQGTPGRRRMRRR